MVRVEKEKKRTNLKLKTYLENEKQSYSPAYFFINHSLYFLFKNQTLNNNNDNKTLRLF